MCFSCLYLQKNKSISNQQEVFYHKDLPPSLPLSLSLSASLALATKVAKSDKGELCGGLASNFPKWVII